MSGRKFRYRNSSGHIEYLTAQQIKALLEMGEGQVEDERWQSGGSVSGQPAKTKQTGNRVEALWGGNDPEGDGEGHGHIASNDGVNADYVRYPGESPIVNNRRSRHRRG